LGDLCPDHVQEIVTRLDVALHIHEQPAGAELRLKLHIKGGGKAWIVAAPVFDENLILRPLCHALPAL
jgi:hypothetical protein